MTDALTSCLVTSAIIAEKPGLCSGISTDCQKGEERVLHGEVLRPRFKVEV